MQGQVLNVYRRDEANVGDAHSSPLKYFRFPGAQEVDIDELAYISDDSLSLPVVIFGGGGLLGRTPRWDDQIRRVVALNARCVVWGAGVNKHLRPAKAREYLAVPFNRARTLYRIARFGKEQESWLPDYVSSFRLAGLRDDAAEHSIEWVPCASCMRTEFDAKHRIVRKVGVLQHQAVPIRLKAIPDEDFIDNKRFSIEEVLHFLASSEAVVTSSYHGAYWSLLLNKPTIVYRPFSTKFARMRHRPTIYSGDLQHDLANARTYPHALEESREANMDFNVKVQNVSLAS